MDPRDPRSFHGGLRGAGGYGSATGRRCGTTAARRGRAQACTGMHRHGGGDSYNAQRRRRCPESSLASSLLHVVNCIHAAWAGGRIAKDFHMVGSRRVKSSRSACQAAIARGVRSGTAGVPVAYRAGCRTRPGGEARRCRTADVDPDFVGSRPSVRRTADSAAPEGVPDHMGMSRLMDRESHGKEWSAANADPCVIRWVAVAADARVPLRGVSRYSQVRGFAQAGSGFTRGCGVIRCVVSAIDPRPPVRYAEGRIAG